MYHLAEQAVNPTDTLASVRLSAITVSMITGTLIPLVVGFLTNIKNSPFLKGCLQILLNGISALIIQATLVDGSAVFTKQTLVVWLTGLATALIAYYNLWKTKGITSSMVNRDVVEDGKLFVESTPGKLSSVGFKIAD
jgi:hypothetical protein